MKNENVILNMRKTISFAQKTNPIWPFASMLLDEKGNPLCIATDCAHISPLFHAETLAIHALISAGFERNKGKISLFSTAEPDSLSQSAIYWAKITHDIDIAHIYYGSSLETIKNLWKFGIDISAQEIVQRSKMSHIAFSNAICEKECDNLFFEAKERQQGNHPARGVLSTEVQDFYMLF
jgi:tRNA(adenine34) deaminase